MSIFAEPKSEANSVPSNELTRRRLAAHSLNRDSRRVHCRREKKYISIQLFINETFSLFAHGLFPYYKNIIPNGAIMGHHLC